VSQLINHQTVELIAIVNDFLTTNQVLQPLTFIQQWFLQTYIEDYDEYVHEDTQYDQHYDQNLGYWRQKGFGCTFIAQPCVSAHPPDTSTPYAYDDSEELISVTIDY
jgi:hypothetical protein